MMRISRLIVIMLPLLANGEPMAAGYDDAELGRLFTTPSQRQAMDRVREGGPLQSNKQSAGRSPATVTVNGIVRRSDGRSMVWVNGKDTSSQRVEGVRVPGKQRGPDKVSVYVDGKLVRVKPGESWSDESR